MRWKLMTSHYLNTKDTEWEYKETDRNTGREKRKQLAVPRFLDINDPGDWTVNLGVDGGVSRGGRGPDGQGEIIVCHKDKGLSGDIAFYNADGSPGDPTPDMVPVDDEAKVLSASFEDHWRYKPDTAEVSYSQSMINRFEVEKAEVESRPQQVEIAGLNDLVAVMAQSLAQNQELIKTLSSRRL